MTDFMRRSSWSWVDHAMLYISAAALLIYLAGDAVGRVEGHFFPVVDSYTAHPLPTTQDKVLISGSFNFVRSNCSFRYLEWHVEGAEGRAPVGVQYGAGVELEPGHNTYQNIPVDVSMSLVHRLRGTAAYQCPWRPWITRTEFFPP